MHVSCRVRRVALVLAFACSVASGCSHGQSATQVSVRYALGETAATRAEAATGADCPRGARCRLAFSSSERRWYLRATMRLRCSPASGTYANPEDACRALDAFLRGQRHAQLCTCPYAGPTGEIVGVSRGRRVHTSLDSCSICNAGPAATAALDVLTSRSRWWSFL